MARPSSCSQKLRERRETGAARAARKQAAREPHRVDDGPGQPRSRQALCLAVEEREVEARVVRDKDGVAREPEKAADGHARVRLPAQLGIVETGESADRGPERNARIDQQLELPLELE